MIIDSLLPLAEPVEGIKLLAGNPRRGDVEAVARSLKKFGQRKPIVVRNDTNEVIAGNHTLRAAIDLGWSEIAVTRVDDDEDMAKAYALADNRTGDLGTYDDIDLAQMMSDVAEAGDDLLEATGWGQDDLDELLAKLASKDPQELTDRDEAPSIPRIPFSRPGDVWQCGPHRVVCGDATNSADMDKALDGKLADLVWTDPPYGVAVVGGTKEKLTIKNDEIDGTKLEKLLDAAFENTFAHSKKGACWYVASPSGPFFAIFGNILTRLGVWRQTIVWVKDSLVLGRADYHGRHEDIFYGWVPADEDPHPPPPMKVDLQPGEILAQQDPPGPDEQHFDEGIEKIIYGWKPGASHQAVPTRKQDTAWFFPKPKRNPDHPCLPAEELVLTEEGWRPIAKLDAGDRVLTHTGQFQPITEVTTSDHEDDLVVIHAEGVHAPVRSTWNHPFLVFRYDRKPNGRSRGTGEVLWVNAEDLQVGDCALTPTVDVPDSAGPGVDRAYAFGLWVAEGCTQRAGHGTNEYLRWTLHSDEDHLAAAIQKAFPRHSMHSYPNGASRSFTHLIADPEATKEFVRLGGKLAHGKRLAPEVLGWSEPERQAVLDGYLDGDGYRLRNEIRAKTVSPDLAATLMLLAQGLGYRCAIREEAAHQATIQGRSVEARTSWWLTFSPPSNAPKGRLIECDGTTYRTHRIQEIEREPFVGQVWNLNIEGDHTFVVNCLVSHNTMKPVDLIQRSIRNNTDPGALVLDPFGGSGSTMIACHHSGRRAALIELDEVYVDVIVRRYCEHSGEKAVRLRDGYVWDGKPPES